MYERPPEAGTRHLIGALEASVVGFDGVAIRPFRSIQTFKADPGRGMVGPAANNTGKPALNDTPVTPDRQDIPIRDAFLGWQCRIRQMAVREHAGYPLPGMRPRLRGPDGRVLAEAITVLIVPREPEKATEAFRHVVRRTRDPLERHEAAVKILSSVFYQHPGEFSDMLTALFAIDSGTADQARAAGECVLEFAQFNQRFRLSCAVAELDR